MLLGINDLDSWCAYQGGRDVIEFKDIYLPNADPELRRLVEKQVGRDITAAVWDVSPFTGDLRALCCNYAPIAVGTASLLVKDNDVYAYLQNNKNSNAYGYKANGTLYGPDSRKYTLNFVWHDVWDPGTTKYNHVWKLQLTPAGREYSTDVFVARRHLNS